MKRPSILIFIILSHFLSLSQSVNPTSPNKEVNVPDSEDSQLPQIKSALVGKDFMLLKATNLDNLTPDETIAPYRRFIIFIGDNVSEENARNIKAISLWHCTDVKTFNNRFVAVFQIPDVPDFINIGITTGEKFTFSQRGASFKYNPPSYIYGLNERDLRDFSYSTFSEDFTEFVFNESKFPFLIKLRHCGDESPIDLINDSHRLRQHDLDRFFSFDYLVPYDYFLTFEKERQEQLRQIIDERHKKDAIAAAAKRRVDSLNQIEIQKEQALDQKKLEAEERQQQIEEDRIGQKNYGKYWPLIKQHNVCWYERKNVRRIYGKTKRRLYKH